MSGDYLALYREIGGPMQWDARLRTEHDALAGFLTAETTWTFVLRDHRDLPAGARAKAIGLCEFDCASMPNVELANFGLIPSAYGQKLGPFLLDAALSAVWTMVHPQRIWLRTDTNDHPAAISVYTKAGFKSYQTRLEDFDD